MTKYIDLLRAHQQEKPSVTKEDSETQAMIEIVPDAATTSYPSSHNPYAKSQNISELEHADGLLEEGIELTVDEQPDASVSNETLIAEDEIVTISLPEAESKADVGTTNQTMGEVAEQTTEQTTEHNSQFDVGTWLEQISRGILTIFQSAHQQQVSDISVLNEMLRSLIDHCNADPHMLDALELKISREIQSIRDIDENTGDLVQKSIMMMLYSIKTGQQLKLQQQELIHITIAAMLHHIGMVMIPDEIRHKKERLTRDELKHIKQAPEAAHTYLQSCHIEDESILLAAAQAAERYDGSGPGKLKGHEIAWSARLVGLLSMFEALTHFRPYRQRFLPRDAIRELVNHHKKSFDPSMLKALIESISLYPVGTFVQINTGEIGQVIMVHNKFPLRPVVLINMDKYSKPIAAREINLKLQPNLMIQKCMYEEALAELKQGESHS